MGLSMSRNSVEGIQDSIAPSQRDNQIGHDEQAHQIPNSHIEDNVAIPNTSPLNDDESAQPAGQDSANSPNLLSGMDLYDDNEFFEETTSDSDTDNDTLLGYMLGTEWTLFDSMRVFIRMSQEVDRLGGPYLVSNFTSQDYCDLLHACIHEDIQYLAAQVGFDLNSANEAILHDEVLEEIENFPLHIWDGILGSQPASDSQNRNDESDALWEETIERCLKTRNHNEGTQGSAEICTVCRDGLYQDDNDDKSIAKLECGHEYHATCIKRWLQLKNLCPVCRAEALRQE